MVSFLGDCDILIFLLFHCPFYACVLCTLLHNSQLTIGTFFKIFFLGIFCFVYFLLGNLIHYQFQKPCADDSRFISRVPDCPLNLYIGFSHKDLKLNMSKTELKSFSFELASDPLFYHLVFYAYFLQKQA